MLKDMRSFLRLLEEKGDLKDPPDQRYEYRNGNDELDRRRTLHVVPDLAGRPSHWIRTPAVDLRVKVPSELAPGKNRVPKRGVKFFWTDTVT